MEAEETEKARRSLVEKINGNPQDREGLESTYGKTWDTLELQEDFLVQRFLAPFIVVTKKDTQELGTLQFQHRPRYYFNWEAGGGGDA